MSEKHLLQMASINGRLKLWKDAQLTIPTVGEEETVVQTADTDAETDTWETVLTDTEEETLSASATEDTQLEGESDMHQDTTDVGAEETEASVDAETSADTSYDTNSSETSSQVTSSDEKTGYEIRVYRDIIGVFDEEGNLKETRNVYVMTLPQADREVLAAGVWMSSYQEVETFLDRLG